MYDNDNPYYRVNDIITSQRLNSLVLMSDQIHTTNLEEIVWDGNDLKFGIQDGNLGLDVVDGNEKEYIFMQSGDFELLISDIPALYDWLLAQLQYLETGLASIHGLELVRVNGKLLEKDIVLTNRDVGSQPAPAVTNKTLFVTTDAVDNYYFYNCEIDSMYSNTVLLALNSINFTNTILEVLDITTNYGDLEVKYFNYNGNSISFIIYLNSDRASRVTLKYKGV